MAFTGIRDYRTDEPTGLREDLLRQNEAIEAAFRDASLTSAARYLPRKVSRDARVTHGEALLVDATRALTLSLPESTQQTRGRLIRVQRMSGAATISVAASGGQLVQGVETDTLDQQVTVREYMDDGDGNWWRAEKAAITSGLSNVVWVDAAAPAGGDGSDESPFNTFTAGVAAVPTGGTLLVCGGTYTGEATANTSTKTIIVRGMGSRDEVLLPDITWSAGGQLHFHDCQLECVGTAFATIRMVRSLAASTGTNCAAVFDIDATLFQGNHAGVTARNSDVSGGLTAAGAAAVSLSHCAVDDVVTSGGTITMLDCSFSSGAALTAATITMDRVSERRAAMAGAVPSVLPTPLEEINPIYGSGITGDVTQSTDAALAQASEYGSLTMASGGVLRLESGILRVRNQLDISAADAAAGFGAIRDWSGGAGAAASGATGGGAWGGTGGSTQGNSGTLQCQSGANGATSAGAQPTNSATLNQGFGGAGGAGGGGGKGVTAGGASRSAASVTNERVSPHWPVVFSGPSSVPSTGSAVTSPVPIMGGHVGQAGSSGGGSAGLGTGGGGGGAGRGGGSVVIYARGIKLGSSTPTPSIVCRGQAGGAGGNGDSIDGNAVGGGGGGAGGGGGLIFIAYDWIIGTPPSGDELDASGGAGGAGGNGSGAGAPGDGGSGGGGGNGGQIVLVNLLTGARSVVTGSAGSAGGAASGSTGGSGGAGGTCTADLP